MTTNTTKRGRLAAILQALREPSTMAGLSLLLTLAGVPPGVPEAVGNVLAGALAVGAVVMREGGGNG